MPDTQTLSKMDYVAMGDAELAAASLNGNQDAFRLIMRRHNQQLFRVARSILQDDAEAEDALQESYVLAFAALATFRGGSSLLTWLTRIVINEARGRLRQRRRVFSNLDAVEGAQLNGASVVSFPGGEPIASPEAETARAEIGRFIAQAVDRLPEPFRLVFVLRDVQECSVEETAGILGLKQETVKTRLHRARRLLRARLEDTLASAMHDAFPFLGKRCEAMAEKVIDRLNRKGSWPVFRLDDSRP